MNENHDERGRFASGQRGIQISGRGKEPRGFEKKIKSHLEAIHGPDTVVYVHKPFLERGNYTVSIQRDFIARIEAGKRDLPEQKIASARTADALVQKVLKISGR